MDLTYVSNLLSPARFEDSTRLYTLRIADEAVALMVVALHGHESLSELSELTIDLVATDALLDIDRWPGRQARLSLRLADGSQAERSGYIREALALDSDGGLAAYRLVLVPGLWLTTRQQRNRVFQDQTVLQIVEEVLAPYAPRVQFRYAEGLDRFVDSARPRSYCVQYRETDHDFLARLLAEEGIGYRQVELRGADAEGDEAPAEADSLGIEPGGLIEFFADSTTLPQDSSAASLLGGPGLRFHAAGSLEAQDGIQAFAGLRQLQAATTTVASYDYKRKQVVTAEVPTSHDFGGIHAPSLEAYDWAGVYAWADGDEATRYATLMREAVEARNKRWLGLATVRTLRPGRWFELSGSPLDSQRSDPEARHFLVTRTVFCGLNNLPRDLSERVARLGLTQTGIDDLSAEDWARAREHGYHTRFEALRRTIPWRPILADGTGARPNPRNVSNPTAPGVQTALVIGPDGNTQPNGADELYMDRLGRIKVRFHWQRAETEGDRGSCWLRVMSRHAGSGYGAQFIPRIGQEVLVGFLDGDIDRPIVLGALYNGQGEAGTPPSPGGVASREHDTALFAQAGDHRPAAQGNLSGGNSPAWHAAAAEHRHAGSLSGFKTKEFGGTGYNQLLFDDADDQQRVQLATSQASTQLNLGHLIHQADNYRGSFRGLGFELRTDAYGAVRAGSGVLMSSYAIQPGEPAADNAPGMALARQALELAKTCQLAAKTHRTVGLSSVLGTSGANQCVLSDSAAPLAALHTALSGMVSGKDHDAALTHAEARHTAPKPECVPHSSDPLLAIAAKGGLSATAGDSLSLAAGENLCLQSGGPMAFAVGGAMRVHSAQALGILAGAVEPGEGNTGWRCIAAKGPVAVQAQADTLAVQAKQDVNLVSATQHIDFAAAKRVHLAVAGGAAITIEGGNITMMCPGTLNVHAGQKSFSGPSSSGFPLPQMPNHVCVSCLLKALNAGSALASL